MKSELQSVISPATEMNQPVYGVQSSVASIPIGAHESPGPPSQGPQKRISESAFIHSCLPWSKVLAARWFRSVSTQREKYRDIHKRAIRPRDLLQQWQMITERTKNMDQQEQNEVTSNLLKKLIKEIEDPDTEFFMHCFLNTDISEQFPDRCVRARGDPKQKMRRIDGGKGSDKVWRIDSVVAMLYHGVPLDSTDSALLIHSCCNELCVRPQHIYFRATSANMALALTLLETLGYRLVPPSESVPTAQSCPVLMAAPFDVEELREMQKRCVIPVPEVLEKFKLSVDDISTFNELPTTIQTTLTSTSVSSNDWSLPGPDSESGLRRNCSGGGGRGVSSSPTGSHSRKNSHYSSHIVSNKSQHLHLKTEQPLATAAAMHTANSNNGGPIDQSSAIAMAAQPPSVYAHLPPYSAASVAPSNYLTLPTNSYGRQSPPHLQPQQQQQISPSLDSLANAHSNVFANETSQSQHPPHLQQQQQHASAFVSPRYKRCSPESATAAAQAAAAAAAVAAAASTASVSSSVASLLPSRRSGSPLSAAPFFRPVVSADMDNELKRVIEKEKTMPMKKRKMTPTGTPVNMECSSSPITVPANCHTPPSSNSSVMKLPHSVRTYSPSIQDNLAQQGLDNEPEDPELSSINMKKPLVHKPIPLKGNSPCAPVLSNGSLLTGDPSSDNRVVQPSPRKHQFRSLATHEATEKFLQNLKNCDVNSVESLHQFLRNTPTGGTPNFSLGTPNSSPCKVPVLGSILNDVITMCGTPVSTKELPRTDEQPMSLSNPASGASQSSGE